MGVSDCYWVTPKDDFSAKVERYLAWKWTILQALSAAQVSPEDAPLSGALVDGQVKVQGISTDQRPSSVLLLLPPYIRVYLHLLEAWENLLFGHPTSCCFGHFAKSLKHRFRFLIVISRLNTNCITFGSYGTSQKSRKNVIYIWYSHLHLSKEVQWGAG